MKNIVFAITRYKYDSYIDYLALIQVSGFPTCFVDEIDFNSDNIYIISPINGEFRPHIDNQKSKYKKRCKIIWWNLERPIEVDPSVLEKTTGVYASDFSQADFLDKYLDQVWLSDRNFATRIKNVGFDKVQFVPMGSDAGLMYSKEIAMYTNYDLIHLSYLTPRRESIIRQLKDKYTIADNSFITESRNYRLKRTKAMLNIHKTDHKLIEPLRLALASAYSMPYFSEESIDNFPYKPNYDMMQFPYSTLVEGVKAGLADQRKLNQLGLNLYRTGCEEFRFKNNILQACEGV